MKGYLKKGIAFLITLVFLLQALIASPLSSMTAFADDEAADEQVIETTGTVAEDETAVLEEQPEGEAESEEDEETIEAPETEELTEEIPEEQDTDAIITEAETGIVTETKEEAAPAEADAAVEDDAEANPIRAGPDAEITADDATEEEPVLRAATTKTVLAFTSDTHNKDGNVAANRLGTWLDKMESIYGKKVDVMAFGGDMANASASESAFWTLTQADMDQLDQRNVTGVYTTGNHEYSPGNYSNGKNSTTQVYVENQEGIEGTNFHIYCLGSSAYAESGSGGSWWGGGGWNTYSSSQVTKLTNYLNGLNDDKPVIVITHYPLHYTSSRTISGAGDVIDALNAASNSGKKIVYLWGHNHTDAPNTETNYDKIFKPGDTITYSNGSSKTIQFYYGAAGCMSDSEYGTGSGSVKGKGLIITIDSENLLSFTYYDASGSDVTEGGTYTEQPPVAIESVTIDEATETGDDGQPVTVIPTVEAGKKLTLHYTPVPADATIRSITWASSNTAVATVDKTGTVKGVSAGTATITATISDGITRGQVVASIDVEIIPRSSSEPMYVLTDTLTPGKNYIIANKNDGEAIALTNNNGSVGLTTVEVENEVIYTELENIVFTADGSGTSVTRISNDGRFLQASNSSLTLVTSAPSNITYAYGTDSKLTARSGNSTYYIYYSTYNGGRYSASTSATSSSSPREVYLFEEVTEQVAVTGVTITPDETTIEARRTVQLTATVLPENATNKKVTWNSSNTSVATVDENGKVRGIAEGTAIITATTADGGKVASAIIHVTPSSATEQHYVIVIDGYALSTDRSPTSAQGGSSSYTYTGLAGVAFASGDTPDDNIRWIIEETEGGYYIKSLDGRYLNATYVSGTNSGTGDLKLDDTPDIWTLDAGYSITEGTVDGSKLKSTNASATASSDKFLGYEESPANLFTVRSEGNADEVTIEEASDPVAVTGVTVTPAEETIEARKTIQLTANITPSNATNKNVTWSSSNTSVATVDTNGKVRGVAEGTATITVTTADGGKTATATIHVTPSTTTEQHYVITVGSFALSIEPSNDQLENAGSGSQRYYYTGLAGAAFNPADVPDDSIRWIIEETTGGYYIKSLDGRYLNATYTQNSTGGYTGVLKLDDTPDVWVLEGSLDSWEIDGSLLKSTNASATASSDKFLAYEEGSSSSPLNLFTVRSEASADETTLVEAEDPIAVTSVTVSPTEATIKVRTTTTLKATVLPENATNKEVTWSSSNTSVATVDANGLVKGIGEGTAVITVTTADGGKTASANITVIPNDNPQTGYIITIGNFALSTDTTTDQLSNNNGAYIYTGMAGVAYNGGDDIPDNIWWELEETDGGYYIKSKDGRYLNATYTAPSNPSASNPTRGVLKLDNTPDVWVLDGTLEDWMIDGSMLKSTNASATASSDKYLAYEEGSSSAPLNLFTIRSEGNADETTVIDPSVTIEERYVETNTLENDKEYIIAVTKDNGSVYVIKNTSGTSTGNTGSATLTVTPASGSDPAYIVTDDETVVWKYSSSNQHMSTSNSHYLGYESSTYNPRVSSQGRAIAYTNGQLTIEGRYLTCSNGTFGTTTTAGSAADVRLFVKTIEIVSCDHTYGEPTWTWTGSDSAGYTAAAAQFTCSKCGDVQTLTDNELDETIVAEAGCTTDKVVTYTAKVTFNGTEYTDTKANITVSGTALGHEYEFKGFTWAEDNTATAKFVCKHDESHVQNVAATVTTVTTDATCETAGSTVYTAKATFEGKEYTDTKTVEIPALGHEYEFKGFTWAEDNTASAKFVCKHDENHVQNVAATVTAVTNDATCETAGSTVYTAKATFEGKEYTDTKTVEIPALGHEYEFKGFTWAEDNSAAAKFVCKHDESHVQNVAATVTAVTTDATCETAGSTVYTAKATFEGKEYTDTKTVEIPALGHDYEFVDFTWTGSDDAGYTAAVANYVCKNDATHKTTIDAAVTSETTPATATEPGKTVYTATVPADASADGKSHVDTKEVEIPVAETTYTLKYDANGGTGAPEAQTVTNITGSAEFTISTAVPTREGYNFKGWGESASATAPVSGTTVTLEYPTTEKTLYAVWEAKVFTVTWDIEGATVEEEYEYGATPLYKGVTPKKAATAQYTYTFSGWTPEITPVTGNVTYKAEFTATLNEYTITFVDEDGTVLQTEKVAYGTTPEYKGETPTKAATAQYTYTFSGWTPEIESVTDDATYKAVYTATLVEYTITWVNWDDTVLLTTKVAYGETPVYSGETPEKPADAQYTYAFSKWTPDIVPVTGEATYKASFVSTENSFQITFVNWDGTVLKSSRFTYGETPVYDDAEPTKPSDAQYDYSFIGWDPELAPVTQDATYTAKYESTLRKYEITFVDEDGNELYTAMVAYGEMPEYKGDEPVKEEDERYTYVFEGWTPELTAVTGTAKYTAKFKAVEKTFTVKFVNWDGEVLQQYENVAYGTTCEYTNAEPTRPGNPRYTYTFAGWNPVIGPVIGNTVYTAQFNETLNEYTVTFVNWDGTVLESGKYKFGDTPEYKGEEPVRAADAQYTYEFIGWDPEIAVVEGNATYTAKYSEILNSYTITWIVNGQTKPETYKYGEMPEYKGVTPVKESDAQYTYEFKGWTPEIVAVTADAEYTAEFTATVRTYTVTFRNWDGTELLRLVLAYGETPVYTGEEPVREPDERYSYKFKGWKPEIAPVAGDAEYTAQYDITGYFVTGIVAAPEELTLVVHNEGRITWTVLPENADNQKVTFTSSNPEIASVDAEGKVTGNKAGKAVITVTTEDGGFTATVTVRVQFKDVTDKTLFYYGYVYDMVDAGIIMGYKDDTFRPLADCTRAAVVTFLWRSMDRPEPEKMAEFSDMTGNEEFDKAISWAAENGIVTGWDDNTFRPMRTCNRAAVVAFLYRMAKKYDKDFAEASEMAAFSDMTGNVEFDRAISWAAENGIVTGWEEDNTFRPWRTCNRLAIVSFIARYLGYDD